jgi:3-deoxy-D-manno-octulosonic-acid transferase
MYFFYSLLTAIAAVVASPFFFIQGLRRGKYLGNLGARFGRVPSEVSARLRARSLPPIWIHAVSVGEVAAAVPLARALKGLFGSRPLVISTTTTTGQQVARERCAFADSIFYFPFDWAWCVRRVFRALEPAAVVILETEIWPNFLREAQRRRVPVIFVNARISENSFARYQRVFRLLPLLRGFLRRVLGDASLFLAQSETSAERLRELGAPREKVFVAGNLKYDSDEPPQTEFELWLARVLERHGRRPVIVAGSVAAHEEPLVLMAFGVLQGEMKNAFLVLAPRKPERFAAAAQHIEESRRRYLRRSAITLRSAETQDLGLGLDILLLDSVGELGSLYRLADGVFIGGSLVAAGGHNILEPAGFGKPPLFGPHMENFSEIAREFLARGAGRQVENPEDLGVAWIELIAHPERSQGMGAAARALVAENRGATARCAARIAEIVERPEGPVELAATVRGRSA